MHENDISGIVLDAAIEAHRTGGGPGLLESAYEEALVWELQARGLALERQKHVPIRDKGHTLATPLRLDLLVADKVIVECVSCARTAIGPPERARGNWPMAMAPPSCSRRAWCGYWYPRVKSMT
jgi:GxxExxY protein